MKFRLTYSGPVRPTGNDPGQGQRNPLAPHKQAMRRVFHRQLAELWRTNKFLSGHRVWPKDWGHTEPPADSMWARFAPNSSEMMPLADAVAMQFSEYGYRFAPLVLERFHLLCSLDILFLRRDPPGSVLSAGDIDNRIKTVIDALRRPRNQMELVGDDVTPKPDEVPFYCLLEDDKQVSRLSVETDQLLDTANGSSDRSEAQLFITVELRPYYATMLNLSFV